MKAFTSVNKAAVHASYIASYEIAKEKKAHTIGEKFLMPVNEGSRESHDRRIREQKIEFTFTIYHISMKEKYQKSFCFANHCSCILEVKIYLSLDEFFNNNSISWKKCAGICTDGAAACTGINSGVVKRVQDKEPHARWTHCFLHR